MKLIGYTFRHLLTHTSGITGLENEDIMAYYAAIGNSKGTLFQQYFMTEDPAIKGPELEELRIMLGTLVRLCLSPLVCLVSSSISSSPSTSTRSSSPFPSSPAQHGPMASVPTGPAA